jgi:outer membrane lipoprotein-sorting protein
MGTKAILLAVALAASPLEQLAQLLQQAPAWQAEFTQTFAPAGFSTTSEEKGIVTFAHPSRLRFEYTSSPKRIFAVDGTVARMVDTQTGSCQAWSLSEGSWAALPLAALSDPGKLWELFQLRQEGEKLLLFPRKPFPELEHLELVLNGQGLPAELIVEDNQANRNRFRFSRWRPLPTIAGNLFTPKAPSGQPCVP